MKRVTQVWLAAVVLAGMIVGLASAQQSGVTQSNSDSTVQEQPLGDYARGVRKDKKQAAAKKFDNDNLPMEDKLSVVGNSSAAAPDQAASQDEQSASAGNDAGKVAKLPSVTPGQSPQEMQQVYSQWQDKISTQKDRVDQLSRELDDLQREYRVRETQLYGDPGNRLRNDWEKEAGDYKKRLDDKQKDLDQAKAGMDTMEEDARKAGVPSSVRESAAQGSSGASSSDAGSPDHN